MRPLLSSENNPLDFVFKNGGSGVDVFFVLSGFILAYRHADRFRESVTPRSYLFFIWLRLARIYPVHLFMLLVVACQLLPGMYHPENTKLAFVANLTLTQAWGVISYLSFNMPAWTISAEWFAYLCFPLLAFTTGRLHPLLWIVLGAVAVYFIPKTYAFAMAYGFADGVAAIHCALHLAVGFFAYQLCRLMPDWILFWRVAAIVMGPVLILLAWYPLGIEAFTLAIAFLMMALFKAGPVFGYANPVSVYMGRISYSRYLVHMPTLWVFATVAPFVPPILILFTTVAAAMVAYHSVEEPGRRFMQKVNPARRSQSPLYRSRHRVAIRSARRLR
jgi:peptidoglycan/LPS O-acetylase OafA/YrhL